MKSIENSPVRIPSQYTLSSLHYSIGKIQSHTGFASLLTALLLMLLLAHGSLMKNFFFKKKKNLSQLLMKYSRYV